MGSGGKVGIRVGVKHPTRPVTWQGPRGQALQSPVCCCTRGTDRRPSPVSSSPSVFLKLDRASRAGLSKPGRPGSPHSAGSAFPTAPGRRPSRWPPERPQPSTPSHGLTPRRPLAFGVPSPSAASPTSRQTHAASSTRADASPRLSDANGHVAPDARGAGGAAGLTAAAVHGPLRLPARLSVPGQLPKPGRGAHDATDPGDATRRHATPRDTEKRCHVLDGAPQSRELRDPNDPGPCSPRTVLAGITTSADSGSSNANLRLPAERLID